MKWSGAARVTQPGCGEAVERAGCGRGGVACGRGWRALPGAAPHCHSDSRACQAAGTAAWLAGGLANPNSAQQRNLDVCAPTAHPPSRDCFLKGLVQSFPPCPLVSLDLVQFELVSTTPSPPSSPFSGPPPPAGSTTASSPSSRRPAAACPRHRRRRPRRAAPAPPPRCGATCGGPRPAPCPGCSTRGWATRTTQTWTCSESAGAGPCACVRERVCV